MPEVKYTPNINEKKKKRKNNSLLFQSKPLARIYILCPLKNYLHVLNSMFTLLALLSNPESIIPLLL